MRQNAFLDHVKEALKLKRDKQLSHSLKSDVATISRARTYNKIGADLILNAHLATDIPVRELMALANKAV